MTVYVSYGDKIYLDSGKVTITLQQLPAKYYTVGYDKMTGFFLHEIKTFF